jgi:hypothetical protein
MTLQFEDLTIFDLDLLKNYAVQQINSSKCDRVLAIVEKTLECIYSKGFKIENYPKNLNLEITKALSAKETSKSANILIGEVFSYLRTHGLSITRDTSRNATWSTLRESFFEKTETRKKSWVY